MRFRGELRATGRTTTGFLVADELVAELGGGGRPKVVVTVNGCTWRGSIARMGGEYWLGVSAERRATAGIAAGEVLDVDVELDTGEREVDVPADLAAALAADETAGAFFAGLSNSLQRYHCDQITGAKTAETRQRRIDKALALFREGRQR